MPRSLKIGDVIQLKLPPNGESLSIEEKLFAKKVEYFDVIHDTSYTKSPSIASKRLLMVVEILSGAHGYTARGLPLSKKTKNSKSGFLPNAVSFKCSDNELSIEYIAVPISFNVMGDWIEQKITQITPQVAKEIGGRKYNFVIGTDPRDQ